MATLDIQKEVKEAMLDDEFVAEFAFKLNQALKNGEHKAEDKVDAGELDVTFNVDSEDPNAFIVQVKDYGTPEAAIAILNNEGVQVQADIDLLQKIMDQLDAEGVTGDHNLMAGLIYKEKKEQIHG